MARFLIACLLFGATVCGSLPLAPNDLPAQETAPLTAVLDLGIAGGTSIQAAAITNQLRVELHRTGRVTLVDRARLEAILKEQVLQDALCTTADCAVRLGRILGIREIIAGDISRIDDSLWQVSVQLIDVETAAVLAAEVYNHSGEYRTLLLYGIPRLAARLVGLPPPTVEALQTTARLTVRVTPADARIAVDGVVRGNGPALEIPLRPGTHEVVVDSPDGAYVTDRQQVTLAENRELHLAVTLRSEADAARREAYADAVDWWGLKWKWALGLGLAVGAWGYLEATDVGASNKRQEDIIQSMKSTTSWTHYLNLRDDLKQAEASAKVHKRNADTGLVLAGAFLGLATWVYLNPPDEPQAARVAVAPVFGGLAGLSLRVRW